MTQFILEDFAPHLVCIFNIRTIFSLVEICHQNMTGVLILTGEGLHIIWPIWIMGCGVFFICVEEKHGI